MGRKKLTDAEKVEKLTATLEEVKKGLISLKITTINDGVVCWLVPDEIIKKINTGLK